ncbi:hypothetical protein, partial [Cryobacterium sp. 5B3]|uniref:hypothetical protein n=1 Tax=Cryobacterium sp. 5B3 TaxID=3048586 RepID=UPI002B223275
PRQSNQDLLLHIGSHCQLLWTWFSAGRQVLQQQGIRPAGDRRIQGCGPRDWEPATVEISALIAAG